MRRFRKVPRKLRRFRKVPRKLREGSARFREGSAKFLKAFPCFQGSARFRKGSAKVAGRFRKVPRVAGCGFHEVTVRIPFRFPLRFPEGSAKVPQVPQRFRQVPSGFLRISLCWAGSARFRESCGKVPQGSAKVPRNFLRLSLASKVPQGSAKVP